jgi:hypothetical protein
MAVLISGESLLVSKFKPPPVFPYPFQDGKIYFVVPEDK